MEIWRTSPQAIYDRVAELRLAAAKDMSDNICDDNVGDAEVSATEFRVLDELASDIEAMEHEKTDTVAPVSAE
jgi:hypothetical protein